jgi:hypothetical protein
VYVEDFKSREAFPTQRTVVWFFLCMSAYMNQNLVPERGQHNYHYHSQGHKFVLASCTVRGVC